MQLREYLAVLWARRGTVVFTVALFVAAAVAAGTLRSPGYTAEARVEVGRADAARTILGIASDPSLVAPDRALQTQSQIVASAPMAEAARRAGKLSQTPSRLLAMVKVAPVESADLLSIRATAASPGLSARVANAFAAAYVARTAAVQRSSIESAIGRLQEQRKAAMSELRQNGTAADGGVNARGQVAVATLSRIDEQIGRLQTSNALELTGTRVVQRAVAPALPDGITGPVPAAAVGLALGLLVAAGVAFAAEHFDTRLRAPADLSALGFDTAGVLPGDRTDRGPSALTMLREPASKAADAYRLLRAEVAPDPAGPLSVLVTSSDGPKAALSVAANLAVAFVQGGSRVALVDADFRHAPLRALFDLPSAAGLTDVVGRGRSLGEVAQYPVHQRLMTIPAGQMPGNPGELLASVRMEQVIAEAASLADVVVLLAPPLSATADALALAPRVDRVLFAVEAGVEREPDVASDLSAVERVRRHAPVSAVLWGVRPGRVVLLPKPATPADPATGVAGAEAPRPEALRPDQALAR